MTDRDGEDRQNVCQWYLISSPKTRRYFISDVSVFYILVDRAGGAHCLFVHEPQPATPRGRSETPRLRKSVAGQRLRCLDDCPATPTRAPNPPGCDSSPSPSRPLSEKAACRGGSAHGQPFLLSPRPSCFGAFRRRGPSCRAPKRVGITYPDKSLRWRKSFPQNLSL
jgi:hypothetical protein